MGEGRRGSRATAYALLLPLPKTPTQNPKMNSINTDTYGSIIDQNYVRECEEYKNFVLKEVPTPYHNVVWAVVSDIFIHPYKVEVGKMKEEVNTIFNVISHYESITNLK